MLCADWRECGAAGPVWLSGWRVGDPGGREGGASPDTLFRATLRHMRWPWVIPKKVPRSRERASDDSEIFCNLLPPEKGSTSCLLKGTEAASQEPWLAAHSCDVCTCRMLDPKLNTGQALPR